MGSSQVEGNGLLGRLGMLAFQIIVVDLVPLGFLVLSILHVLFVAELFVLERVVER